MVAQTNHQLILSAVENKLTRWFIYEREKPTRQKSHWVILGHHSRIPLLSQQTVTSKGISVPYINLQLNPYPNI